ncbi:MAG: divergent polysaccharide deacetylase family protein, partial [Rhodobacteraceae bacterium]|nr:divergent polysaccharide deacetylase family protein [Paracoccaceae bacterium]
AEAAPNLAETSPAAAPDGDSLSDAAKSAAPTAPMTAEVQPGSPADETTKPELAAPAPLPTVEAADTSDKILAHVSGAGQESGIPLPPMVEPPAPAGAGAQDSATPPAATTLPLAAPDAAADAAAKPRMLTMNPKPDATATKDMANKDLTIPGLKAAPLPASAPGIKIIRPAGKEVVPPVAEGEPIAESAATLPPRRAFAAPWTNPDKKPVLAVILLDQGPEKGGMEPAALDGLPFPVTIALDPESDSATVIAAAHRAAGKEVAILAGDLPKEATEADFEVAYQSYVSHLPESVALMGLPDASFQTSSLAAQHVAALLSQDGRGLITFTKGLNPGRGAAEKAGVGVASVDKLFDMVHTENGSLMRELDRAAFAAGQKGVYVIALPSTPEAITGLMTWAAG